MLLPRASGPKTARMKRILIIEDDPLTAKIYRDCLERAGYYVDVAADGRIGLDRLTTFRPDGILLDSMLPGINGIDLLIRIRATDEFQKLPVIAFTNLYIPGLVEQMKAAGATDIFDKAELTPALLISSFQAALSVRK